MDRCPICGVDYTPSEEIRLKEMRRQAWMTALRGLAHGERSDSLMTGLIREAQVSSEQATIMMDLAKRRLRQISRDRGIRLLSYGLLLWFVAFVVLALTRGLLISTGCATLGFAAIVVGGIKIITGWNLADNLGASNDFGLMPDLDEMLVQ